jgi:hypothetical protein
MKGSTINWCCTLSCGVLALAMAVPSFAQRLPLDPMTVTCVGATETTITVRVCAGPSGAPGGFSLQWIKKSDWEAGPDGILGTDDDNSWPLSDDPRICKASFSGQANNTNWNLGPIRVPRHHGRLSGRLGRQLAWLLHHLSRRAWSAVRSMSSARLPITSQAKGSADEAPSPKMPSARHSLVCPQASTLSAVPTRRVTTRTKTSLKGCPKIASPTRLAIRMTHAGA